MEAANVSQPPGQVGLTNYTGSSQMQPETQMHANHDMSPQSPINDDDKMENVIVVRTSPASKNHSKKRPAIGSSPNEAQLPAQISSPAALPLLTRPSPPRTSPAILPARESTPAEQFTPLISSQPIQSMSSPGPYSPLPPMALPLRPATPNSFLASFGNRGGGFGSPGPLGSPGTSPTLSPGVGKRKRLSEGQTILLPRIHSFQNIRSEDISDTVIVSQPSSAGEKTDEDEPENPGKKRKIKGIMKKSTSRVAPNALPSPGTERAELLFDMDRLSIENDAEESGEGVMKGQRVTLGEVTGVADAMDSFENVESESLMDGIDTTISEEENEDSEDQSMGIMMPSTSRVMKPLPSRRRLRSPPPPPPTMDDDEEHAPGTPTKDDEDEEPMSPPLPSESVIPGEDDEDDDEDLNSGTKGVFYYKPTPAQKWARNQKRLQQIREYKARESREEREKRRRRRASSTTGRTGGGGAGGKMASVARKVRFSA